MISTLKRKLNPQNYLQCLAEKSRALAAHDHHQAALAKRLGVPVVELQGAIDRLHGKVMDVSVVMLVGKFLKAEKELDEAISAYDLAVEIHQRRSFQNLDE